MRHGRQKWILLSTSEEWLPGLGRFLFLSFSLKSILIYILLPRVGKKKTTLLVLPGNVFLLKAHCHNSVQSISELQAPNQEAPFRRRLRHLENQQEDNRILKGGPWEQHPTRLQRMLPNSKGSFPLLLSRYLPQTQSFLTG